MESEEDPVRSAEGDEPFVHEGHAQFSRIRERGHAGMRHVLGHDV